MAAHGKKGMEEMVRRQAERKVFANLRNLYVEVMGKQPQSQQSDSDANAAAMVRQMVDLLEKAWHKPVNGVSKLLGDEVNHMIREQALISYAYQLQKLCTELGLSTKNKGMFGRVRALLVGELKR